MKSNVIYLVLIGAKLCGKYRIQTLSILPTIKMRWIYDGMGYISVNGVGKLAFMGTITDQYGYMNILETKSCG